MYLMGPVLYGYFLIPKLSPLNSESHFRFPEPFPCGLSGLALPCSGSAGCLGVLCSGLGVSHFP